MDKLPIETKYDADILSAVAALTLTAAAIEHHLTMALFRLLTHRHAQNPHAMMPLEGMEVRVKLQLLKAASAIMVPERREEIAKLVKKLDDAFGTRNLFAHGMVSGKKSGDRIMLYRIKTLEDGSVPQPVCWTADQIRQAAWKIETLSASIHEQLDAAGVREFLEE